MAEVRLTLALIGLVSLIGTRLLGNRRPTRRGAATAVPATGAARRAHRRRSLTHWDELVPPRLSARTGGDLPVIEVGAEEFAALEARARGHLPLRQEADARGLCRETRRSRGCFRGDSHRVGPVPDTRFSEDFANECATSRW